MLCGGDRLERLTRLLEGSLGWPVVDLDDPGLPPVAVVVDVAGRARLPDDAVGPPLVLLVGEDDPPLTVARAARGALHVLAWPPAPAALRAALAGGGAVRGRRPWCTVVGSAGGVGASAVALGLAGVRAWTVGRTLAALSGPCHLQDVPVVGPDELTSPAAWAAAAAVPGVEAMRVVGLATDWRRAGRPGEAGIAVAGEVPTVLDLGVLGPADVPDVLVVGPDRAGLDAAGSVPARAVVLRQRGAGVPVAALRRAAAPAPVHVVAEDGRVARACLAGRLPTDAPGSWLRPLAAVAAGLGDRQEASHPAGPTP